MTARPDCRALLSSIGAYLDGELDAPACQAVDAHCAGCDDCRAVVAGLRRTIGICQEAAAAPLPDEVRRRARDRVRALLDTPPGDR